MVIILAAGELGKRGLPGLMRRQLEAEISDPRAAGSLVSALVADAASQRAMGAKHHNPLHKAPTARAGYRQGVGRAETLRRFLAKPSAAANA